MAFEDDGFIRYQTLDVNQRYMELGEELIVVDDRIYLMSFEYEVK